MITASVAVEDEGLLDEVKLALRGEPVRLVGEQSQLNDIEALVEQLRQAHPDIALIDVGSLREPVLDVMNRIRPAVPDAFIVALNTKTEPASVLDCFHAGVNDYLVAPVKNGLQNALHNRMNRAADGSGRPNKTLAFLSAKGGCGASTLVCHVAAELGRLKQKVLLADLDPDSGIVDFLTGMKASYSIGDAFRNVAHLDTSYWGALVCHREPGLDILVQASQPEARLVPSNEQLDVVLGYARRTYDWTLLDLGRGMNAGVLAAARLSDELCLVVEPNIPALHQARGIIRTLFDAGYNRERIHLVLNRVPRRLDLDSTELWKVLGLDLYAAIQFQEIALHDELAEGDFLSTHSELAQDAGRLARKLSGQEQTAKRRFSFFR